MPIDINSDKIIRLKLVMTRDYIVPVHKDYPNPPYTNINGWTMEEVIEDWFHRVSLDHSHATRDGMRIGNGQKVIKVLNMGELK
jgi:hypothetical protein